MQQDFTRKMAVVVRKDLPSWQAMNTVGHCSAYLGNKMREPFDTGDCFSTKGHLAIPRNSQYPIIVLAADADTLVPLVREVRESGVLFLIFVREMIEHNDDAELQSRLQAIPDSDLDVFGIGMFGDKRVVDELTKKFALWK
ncbi:MAG: DUF2000 domain-containing protein [Candidatus Sungbacteria bacterium]|nr:DUF2000 domain-containing protein [Candidatus Sungbacteria bacterium]